MNDVVFKCLPILVGAMLIVDAVIRRPKEGVWWYHRLIVAALGVMTIYFGVHGLMHH